MIRIPAVLLLISFMASPLVGQQSDDLHPIRMAAVEAVDRIAVAWSNTKDSAERLLGPETPKYNFDGKLLHPLPTAPKRAAEVTAELARALGAGLAVASDSIRCPPRGAPCSGTRALLLHLSEPWQQGDSAAVMVSMQQRYREGNPEVNGKPVDGYRYYQIMLFLKRIDGKWKALTMSQIGITTISKAVPIDSMIRR